MSTIHCAVCLYVREGEAPAAETIINGTAVCYDHMGYLAVSEPFRTVQHLARERT